MGTRLPSPDIDPGDNCPACTGDGLPWETGKNPQVVIAVFNYLEACPNFTGILPNGDAFPLSQDPETPCRWIHDGLTWYISFYATLPFENFSELLLIWRPENKIAFQGREQPCPFEYQGIDNLIENCGPNVCCKFGIGYLSWSDIAIDVAEGLVIAFSERLMHESFPHEDGSIVLKYCDKRDATNVKIKYSFA